MFALSLLLGQSRLRHLCLRFLFLLVLLLGGLGMLRAEGSEPDGLSAEHVEHIGTFALPDAPEMNFNPETGELETTDAEGKPQRIKLDLPEGGDYTSAFPMVITDAGGNEYQVSEQSSTYGVDERSSNRQTEAVALSEETLVSPLAYNSSDDSISIRAVGGTPLANGYNVRFIRKSDGQSLNPSSVRPDGNAYIYTLSGIKGSMTKVTGLAIERALAYELWVSLVKKIVL